MTLKMFFDVETVADPEMVAMLPEPVPPSNYKDEAKIKEYVEGKRAEAMERGALDFDTACVRSICTKLYDVRRDTCEFKSEKTAIVPIGNKSVELDVIKDFWLTFQEVGGECCGYNILSFDLPLLQRRAFEFGYNIPTKPEYARYRMRPVTDLYAILNNWGTGKSLKWIVKRYGIPNPLPELDGSMVAKMDDETVKRYVINDVDMVVVLFCRMYGVYFNPYY